jgi:excisionase family DNA binding protein
MNRLLTVDEVAERLGVAPRTLYRWFEQGRLGGVKVGRLVRFREEDIDAFLDVSLASPESGEVRR